ncbi:MAG: hypothetical protein IKR63_08115 [Alloprevotella sp.]|nr:hypothetical protein [Alloprevotella sp.]
MKHWMLMSLMALCCCLGFTACGDDDDDFIDDPDKVVVNDGTITEMDNQLVLKCTAKATQGSKSAKVNLTWTCDFENERCVKSAHVWTYSTEAQAKAYYEGMTSDPEEARNFTLVGKTVVEDSTEDFMDWEKDRVRHEMEEIKNGKWFDF